MLHTLGKKLLFEQHVCPWWLAYSFDHRVRNLFHDPSKILKPYVKVGMTVLDIGCGMGFFSIGMAKLIGESGKVISIDIQEKMITVLKKRAQHAGMNDRISPQKVTPDNILVKEKIDFALSFWMIHEVPDKTKLLKQVYAALKKSAIYLIVEPKIHTTQNQFNEIAVKCEEIGFKTVATPKIFLSRASAFQK